MHQYCAKCGEVIPVYFTVPLIQWQSIIPIELQDKKVCLHCFVAFAQNKELKWDTNIKFYPVDGYYG